jgi:hypothetical protein
MTLKSKFDKNKTDLLMKVDKLLSLKYQPTFVNFSLVKTSVERLNRFMEASEYK